jgi:DNA-binding response OmpR family regulator
VAWLVQRRLRYAPNGLMDTDGGDHMRRSGKRAHAADCDDVEESRPARVLLAEDDAEMRALIAEALRSDGHEVVEVSDGWQLLQSLATRSLPSDDDAGIDLLISDIRMPGKNGLDVLAGMRWADWPMPVILITAFGDAKTHAEARRLGAAAVFDKPFELDDLRMLALNLLL